MVLKKVDNRIRVLIENGVQKRHRSLFVVVGDKGKDQVSYEIKLCLLLGLKVFPKLKTINPVHCKFSTTVNRSCEPSKFAFVYNSTFKLI